MTKSIPTKEFFSLTELARAIDKHVSTIVRWTRRGVRGHILKSFLLGGQRYIDRRDYVDFLEAINVASAGTSRVTAPNREDQLQRVHKELDIAGI